MLPVASRFDLSDIDRWNRAIAEITTRHGATLVDLRETWRDVKELSVAQGKLSVKQGGKWLPWVLLDVSAVLNPHLLFALVGEDGAAAEGSCGAVGRGGAFVQHREDGDEGCERPRGVGLDLGLPLLELGSPFLLRGGDRVFGLLGTH